MHVRLTSKSHPCQPHASRAWVWVHQSDLNRQLADGVDPSSSEALQLRARQLQSMQCRHALAAEIDTVMAKAEHPPHWHSATIPVRAREVIAASAELLALRTRLLGSDPCWMRGIGLVACLVRDSDGPVYHSGPRTVAQLAEVASAARDSEEDLSRGLHDQLTYRKSPVRDIAAGERGPARQRAAGRG